MCDELSVSPNRGGKVILRFEFNLHYPPPILTGKTLQLPTKVELLLIMISVSECSLSLPLFWPSSLMLYFLSPLSFGGE